MSDPHLFTTDLEQEMFQKIITLNCNSPPPHLASGVNSIFSTTTPHPFQYLYYYIIMIIHYSMNMFQSKHSFNNSKIVTKIVDKSTKSKNKKVR